MKLHYTTIIFSFLVLACSTHTITNKKHNELSFSEIKSNLLVHDENNYGCGQISLNDLSFLLTNSSVVTNTIIHDQYSIVGCNVKGNLLKNGTKVDFTFDYGGVFYFNDGTIMACGESCCDDDYEFCSWDPEGR